MIVIRILLIAPLLFVTGQASASIIDYEYQFDTPVFADPPFAPLNTLLSGAGSTIEGSITLDTDKIFSSGGGLDTYRQGNGGYTHTGELDILGFDVLSDFLDTFTGTTNLHSIYLWEIDNPSSDIDSIQLGINFGSFESDAFCYSESGDGCDGVTAARDIVDFTNFSLTKTVRDVPEPATLALFGLGLAGLGFARKKKKSA